MQKYIGSKIIEAEPALRVTGKDFTKRIQPVDQPMCIDDTYEHGYKVIYPDGYESWSPKDVFEEAYRPTDGMSFGLALEAAKKGERIARKNWNGKNQYIELATAISYKNASGEVVNAEHDTIGNKAIAFVGTSGVQMGWLASQADMLSDDWYIVE